MAKLGKLGHEQEDQLISVIVPSLCYFVNTSAGVYINKNQNYSFTAIFCISSYHIQNEEITEVNKRK